MIVNIQSVRLKEQVLEACKNKAEVKKNAKHDREVFVELLAYNAQLTAGAFLVHLV